MLIPQKDLVFYFLPLLLLSSCMQFKTGDAAGSLVTHANTRDSVLVATFRQKANNADTQDSALFYLKALSSLLKERKNEKLLYSNYIMLAQRYLNNGNNAMYAQYFDSAKTIAQNTSLHDIKVLYKVFQAKLRFQKDTAIVLLEEALKDSAWLSPGDMLDIYGMLSVEFVHKKYYKTAKEYSLACLNLMNAVPVSKNKLYNKALLYLQLYEIEKKLEDSVSALPYLKKAVKITEDSLTGMPLPAVHKFMRDYYLQKGMADSARIYQNQYFSIIQNDTSAAAADYRHILEAELYFYECNTAAARKALLSIKTLRPGNYFFGNIELIYFDTKYKLAKQVENYTEATEALEQKLALEARLNSEDKKSRLAEFEEKLIKARAQKTIAEKEQKVNQQRLYTLLAAIAALVMAVIGYLLYNNQRRKKIRAAQLVKEIEQRTIIEKTQLCLEAETVERSRISQEIHDDIGPVLTSLNMAANMIGDGRDGSDYSFPASVISKNTKLLSTQMSEIIWGLNSNNDNLESLTSFCRKFAAEFLSAANIRLNFQADIQHQQQVIEGYKRRAIYLSFKEIINNAVKYSKTPGIDVHFTETGKKLIIIIKDNGIGLPAADKMGEGNGLRNIEMNIKKAGGRVMNLHANGLTTILDIPLFHQENFVTSLYGNHIRQAKIPASAQNRDGSI